MSVNIYDASTDKLKQTAGNVNTTLLDKLVVDVDKVKDEISTKRDLIYPFDADYMDVESTEVFNDIKTPCQKTIHFHLNANENAIKPFERDSVWGFTCEETKGYAGCVQTFKQVYPSYHVEAKTITRSWYNVTGWSDWTSLSDEKANKDIISDAYDSSATYEVGDYFIDNNIMYKVLVTCVGVTPPNATYYKPTSVAEELNKKIAYNLYSFDTETLPVGTNYVSIPELNTTNLIGCSVVSASPSYSYSDLSDIEFKPSDNKLAITVKVSQKITLKVISFHISI